MFPKFIHLENIQEINTVPLQKILLSGSMSSHYPMRRFLKSLNHPKIEILTHEDNINGDLEIIFTGLRPGEKLYEELLIDNKSKSTAHHLIYKAEEKYILYEKLMPLIEGMKKALINQDLFESLSLLKQIVPEWERNS